jgi:hypothetical protein
MLNLGVAEASGNFPIITSANPDLLSSNRRWLNVVGQVIKHVYLKFLLRGFAQRLTSNAATRRTSP